MRFIIACNWKLFYSYRQTLDWLTAHAQELALLTKQTEIILCSSFEALASARELLDASLKIGAQDCSAHDAGAYTGQVSARSLKEVGCSYVIIGHHETRSYTHDDEALLPQKLIQAIDHQLIPLIAIGEPLEIYQASNTQAYLEKSMALFIKALKKLPTTTIYIAYEPLWSIGSGLVPENNYLEGVLQMLRTIADNQLEHHTVQILYGGSVSSKNAGALSAIRHLDGFLIGKASTDFQELKKIVSLVAR